MERWFRIPAPGRRRETDIVTVAVTLCVLLAGVRHRVRMGQ